MAFSFSYISRSLDEIIPPAETTTESLSHFSFDSASGSFTANGCERMSHERLMEILFPEKDWFASQLRHYGIPFRPSDPVPKLRATLESAVKEGKCKNVPEHISRLEQELRQNFNSTNGFHHNQLINGSSNNRHAIDTSMELCSPPRSKLPLPVTNGNTSPSKKRRADESLPTPSFPAEEDLDLPPSFPATGDLFKDATGTYEIECFDITSRYPVNPDSLNLAIFIPTLGGDQSPVGMFDFSVISGVMKFTAKESSIGKYRQDDLDDISQESNHSSNGKRKADGMQSRKKRARRSMEAPKRRLYFQWRGQSGDVFGGEVHWQNQLQVGYIDFDDDACSSFTGVASFPSIGERCKFVGYKVSKGTGQVDQFPGRSWENYAEPI